MSTISPPPAASPRAISPAGVEQFGLTPEIGVAWLERVIAALEPQGARIWVAGQDGPRPFEELGPPWSSLELAADERRRYLALIGSALRGGTGKIAEPRSASLDALEGANPTDGTLLVCPLTFDGRQAAVVEAWYGGPVERAAQDLAAEKLSALCATLRDELSEQRRHAARRQIEFAAQLAGQVELDFLAREIVTGLCTLVRADRVVLCRLLHGRWRVVSAADAEGLAGAVDDEPAILRAADVRSRSAGPEIVSGVRETGTSPTAEDAASADAESLSYAEHTDVKTAAFLPLVRRTDTKAMQTEFVLVAEWYRREALDPAVHKLLDEAAPLMEASLEAARRCEALPLRRLSFGWARLKLSSPLRGVPLPLVLAGGLAVAGLITLVVPWNHTLAAPGTLRPVVRQGVFAETDGVVDEILVADGAEVKRGDVLVRMSNPELAIAVADCQKRLAEAEQELRSTERRYGELRMTDPDARARLPGQIEVLRQRVEGLRTERRILAEKSAALVVVSPIDGRVATWDLRQSLSRRPVRRGELLIYVADPGKGWEAEIRLPQRRYGELSAARRELSPALDVDLSPTSEPSRSFRGRLTRVDRRADIVNPEEGSVVLLAADAEIGNWPASRDGAEVRARIHCGRRSLGYVLFRDGVDWCRSTLFYLFPY